MKISVNYSKRQMIISKELVKSFVSDGFDSDQLGLSFSIKGKSVKLTVSHKPKSCNQVTKGFMKLRCIGLLDSICDALTIKKGLKQQQFINVIRINANTYRLEAILKNAMLSAVLQAHNGKWGRECSYFEFGVSATRVIKKVGIFSHNVKIYNRAGSAIISFTLRLYNKDLSLFLYKRFELDAEITNHRFELVRITDKKYKLILDN